MADASPSPSDLSHLVPQGAVTGAVDLTILVPALNEEVTVGEFVDWCREGLRRVGLAGQILLIDSSTDETPRIALQHGAEVLRVPKRGLGRAYLDALPYVRGRWIVMGDADLTYDFRELEPFVAEFRRGAEFIMGSRFGGGIETGAMPGLHRYFGTPLTTWILNSIYGSSYRDIHCGMRGITRPALDRIRLRSQSWEYASEMVLKAARLGLRQAEVPVKFYKDRKGRVSHHRRQGWLSPWRAGWLNLKVMLVYSPDSFVLLPGWILLILGLGLSLMLARGPVTLGGIGFDLNWMLLGVTCATLGYSSLQLGILARIMHGLRSGGLASAVRRSFGYNRGMIAASVSVTVGILLELMLVRRYIHQGLKLTEISHPGIFGLFLIILGFQTFGFTLLLEMSQRVSAGD